MFTYSTIKYIIYLGGIHAICFAVFHGFFWKLFGWKNELKKLSLANKAIIQIANLRLIYIFLSIGVVCFIFPKELLSTELGNVFLLGISLFWLGRTIEQFIFLKINHKLVHLLTVLFILGIILFAAPVIIKLLLFTPCN